MCHPEVVEGRPALAVKAEEVGIPVAEGELPAMLARPRGETRGSVLIFHDVYGRNSFYKDLARRLASAGYEALLPDFFHHEGALEANTIEAASRRRERADSRRMLSEALTAADWVGDSAEGRIGVIGFCMGGNYALAMAAERADLATVCYYGFPGRPIHFSQDPGGPTPIDLAPAMRGPILGLWGEEDEGVGMDNVTRFAEAMRACGGDFEHHVYPGAGHGFLRLSELEPGHALYDVACDSWTRTVTFLRQHVGQPVRA
jgi:carboxymethylenebutenolidase